MTFWTWLAVVYLLGVGIFIAAFRSKVLGGWFQTCVTALIWPVVLAMVAHLWITTRWGRK